MPQLPHRFGATREIESRPRLIRDREKNQIIGGGRRRCRFWGYDWSVHFGTNPSKWTGGGVVTRRPATSDLGCAGGFECDARAQYRADRRSVPDRSTTLRRDAALGQHRRDLAEGCAAAIHAGGLTEGVLLRSVGDKLLPLAAVPERRRRVGAPLAALVSQGCCGALADGFALPLSDDAEHIHDHTAGGGAGVKSLADRNESDPVLGAQVDELAEIAHAPREAIQLGDNDALDAAGPDTLEQRRDSGRLRLLALSPASRTVSDTENPIARAYAPILASCASRETPSRAWSSVETRTYATVRRSAEVFFTLRLLTEGSLSYRTVRLCTNDSLMRANSKDLGDPLWPRVAVIYCLLAWSRGLGKNF